MYAVIASLMVLVHYSLDMLVKTRLGDLDIEHVLILLPSDSSLLLCANAVYS